jgi:hypothetical protein
MTPDHMTVGLPPPIAAELDSLILQMVQRPEGATVREIVAAINGSPIPVHARAKNQDDFEYWLTIETVWVSFADEHRFRGVAIVDVDTEQKAKKKKWTLAVIARTIEMNCNAGPDTSVQIQGSGRFIDCDHKNKLILDEALLGRIGEELAQRRRLN